MKYAVIQSLCHQEPYPVRVVCRALQVAPNGYYAWLRSPQSRRAQADVALLGQIVALFHAHRGRLGSPRLHALLRQSGVRVGRKRVARLMREAGLVAHHKQRFRRYCTTDSRHPERVAPNRLNRDFTAERPNQKWVGDLTYLPTAEGWVYVAVLIDLFSRRVVGWHCSEDLSVRCVEAALRMALRERQPLPGSVLHHSDRGSQYASRSYQSLLQQFQLEGSMSSVGCCYDNALVESFFATLKVECGSQFPSRAAAKLAVFDYLEGYYNRSRPHSALGYLSPMQFEQEWARRQRTGEEP
jgi:transposase InsO family protein